jgi:REP element-mobilizing transposase RayT
MSSRTNVCRVRANFVTLARSKTIAGHAGKMPRPPRIEVPGGFFHVRVRGVNGERIFLCARDRLVFLQIVETLVGRCDWTCFAYCLMDNHFHLVIRTNQPTLGEGMHILNGRWARFVNDEYARDGHLFGQRYRSKAIEDDAQLLETSRYVVLNPVRAGLCDRGGFALDELSADRRPGLATALRRGGRAAWDVLAGSSRGA